MSWSGSQKDCPSTATSRWTDGTGTAQFYDPILAFPQTVTAAAEGFGRTTLIDAALGAVTLALYPAAPDSTMGGLRTVVQGQVTGIETTPNDGYFDAAVILPAIAASSYALQDALPFLKSIEQVEFPLIGTLPMASNIYMPDQAEFVFLHFEKSPYTIDLPGDRPTTFVSVSARIAITDLIAGTAPQNAVVREVGVERDVFVPRPGPFTQNIASDLALSNDLAVSLRDVPDGAHVQVASAALITVDGIELVVGYDTRGDIDLQQRQDFELATRAPGGDLSDARNIAVATYMDSSAALEWTTGIFDRSGFIPPYDVTFDSWMHLPELDHGARLFSWSDVTNPGVSPAPTWTRSNLGLRPIDPQDSTVAITVDWRIYAPAEPRRFWLPSLPPSAPAPPGGLPNPDTTPGEDQLYWSLVAANPVDDVDVVLRDFMHGGTHWSSRWIPIDVDESAPEIGGQQARIRLSVTPRPASGPVRLAWDGPDSGDALLTITASDGRLICSKRVGRKGGEFVWDGRDLSERPLPGGVYWAALSAGGALLAREAILWITP